MGLGMRLKPSHKQRLFDEAFERIQRIYPRELNPQLYDVLDNDPRFRSRANSHFNKFYPRIKKTPQNIAKLALFSLSLEIIAYAGLNGVATIYVAGGWAVPIQQNNGNAMGTVDWNPFNGMTPNGLFDGDVNPYIGDSWGIEEVARSYINDNGSTFFSQNQQRQANAPGMETLLNQVKTLPITPKPTLQRAAPIKDENLQHNSPSPLASPAA